MEKLHGKNQGYLGRGAFKAVDMGSSNTHHSHWRILWIVLFSLSIGGCSLAKLKTAVMTGSATGAVVGVTSALVPGALVPAAAGALTAATASALTAPDQIKGEPIEVQAETFVQEAPDNFWSLLGKLISMGGWALILIVIVPMLFSWLLPGPIRFKKRKE